MSVVFFTSVHKIGGYCEGLFRLSPDAAAARNHFVRFGRAPAAGVVVVELAAVGFVGEDGFDEFPAGMYRVGTREQGGVAFHRVQQQAFVGGEDVVRGKVGVAEVHADFFGVKARAGAF